MKKIYMIMFILVLGNTSYGQNFYNFSRADQEYQNLVNATKISGDSTNWMLEQTLPIDLPMNISVFGNEFNKVLFTPQAMYFVNEDYETTEELALFQPLNAMIIDRGYSEDQNNLSLSELSYVMIGELGSRILKVEVKNFGLLLEYYMNSSMDVFLNYQIWFYEDGGKIEIHYGPNNITDLSLINFNAVNSMFFGTAMSEQMNVAGVSGTIPNEVYTELEDEMDAPLSGITPANTVYIFNTQTASNTEYNLVELKLYPNPAEDMLHLEFKENISESFSVFDLSGKKVLTDHIDNKNQVSIPVEDLVSGVYFLKIGSSTYKFIKK